MCGHGVEAARTATRVKDTVHAFAHGYRHPHDVLRETNLLLIERGVSGFVTAFLGFLDPETGELDYSAAGHPAQVIVGENSEIDHLGSPSFPLGVFQDSTYKTQTAGLGRDSLLVLYTDGVIEARREDAFFAEAGLLESLRHRTTNDLEVRGGRVCLDSFMGFLGDWPLVMQLSVPSVV